MNSNQFSLPQYAFEMFNHPDQGYVVVEISYDSAGKPVDIYYGEANPAANQMTEIELAGKHIGDLDPNYEQHWFEVFGRVAKTGIAEKRTLAANPLCVINQFHAFKVAHLKNAGKR